MGPAHLLDVVGIDTANHAGQVMAELDFQTECLLQEKHQQTSCLRMNDMGKKITKASIAINSIRRDDRKRAGSKCR